MLLQGQEITGEQTHFFYSITYSPFSGSSRCIVVSLVAAMSVLGTIGCFWNIGVAVESAKAYRTEQVNVVFKRFLIWPEGTCRGRNIPSRVRSLHSIKLWGHPLQRNGCGPRWKVCRCSCHDFTLCHSGAPPLNNVGLQRENVAQRHVYNLWCLDKHNYTSLSF